MKDWRDVTTNYESLGVGALPSCFWLHILQLSTVKSLGGEVLFRYKSALLGFSARVPPNALQAVRAIPGVAYLEADRMGSVDTIQLNPPTGLDRTSERLLGITPAPALDNRYTYSETGLGVHAYILDSGIRVTHTDFGGERPERSTRTPTGTVRFSVNERMVGDPVKLDSDGRATWTTSSLRAGNHQIGALYFPTKGSMFLSSSGAKAHTIRSLKE